MTHARRICTSVLAVVTLVLAVGVGPTGADTGSPFDPRGRDPRIIGGTPAPAGSWRSQAALLRRGVGDRASALMCGGTVIDPTWVVTAAHCVTNLSNGVAYPPDRFDVLVGTHDLAHGGSRIPVARVVVRPDWDVTRARNDVALLHLARPARVPIDLQVAGRTDVPWSGAPVRTAGWGFTESGMLPTALREVTLAALDPGECREVVEADEVVFGGFPYHSSQLCAGAIGAGGKGTCNGDSGGPLVWETGGRKVLVGLVSWGAYCGSPESPSVFAKVASSSAWIPQTIAYGPLPDGQTFALVVLDDYLQLGELVEVPPAPSDPAAFVAEVQSRPSVQRRDGALVRLYDAVFGRQPDAWGYEYWRSRLTWDGIGVTHVAGVMARSAEFRATYGNLGDQEFVEQLYLNVLGRHGAPGDVAYWVARLAGGDSRGRVVALLSESPENRARTQAEVDVDIAFLDLVGRAPAAHEIATWAGRPVAELARMIIHSQAYAARYSGWFGTFEG